MNFGSVLLDERESFLYLPRELFVNESNMRPMLYSQQIVRTTESYVEMDASELKVGETKSRKVEEIVYRAEDLNTGLKEAHGFDFAWNETDVGMGFASKTIGSERKPKALEYAQKRDAGLFRHFDLAINEEFFLYENMGWQFEFRNDDVLIFLDLSCSRACVFTPQQTYNVDEFATEKR